MVSGQNSMALDTGAVSGVAAHRLPRHSEALSPPPLTSVPTSDKALPPETHILMSNRLHLRPTTAGRHYRPVEPAPKSPANNEPEIRPAAGRSLSREAGLIVVGADPGRPTAREFGLSQWPASPIRWRASRCCLWASNQWPGQARRGVRCAA